MSEAAALQVDDLGVRYGGFQALEGMSWSVAAGEILGVIGPNGAGKSTCMAATTNSVKHAGTIRLLGDDVTKVPTAELSRRGLRRTFQQNAFYGELSVLENASSSLIWGDGTGLAAATFMPLRERRSTARRISAAGELLDRFAIPRMYFDEKPSDIPYGTQRMLALALAYASAPVALLIDEPAAGVGGTDMKALADKLKMLKAEGIALVVIEHHMDLIMTVADRIVVLDRGRMLATGTPQEIRTNEKVLEAYLGRAA
ncbi:MAG: branched-chain amino acid transporter ATP-binding protein [Rhodoglobus sp.]|nr:branched-chain amino acid transporter ATP-binding protein [Rhodoglobus sp.]